MGIEPSALAEVRRRLGMTQGRMAAFLRVGRNTVVRWENGAHRPRPYLAHALRALADEVGVDLEAEYATDTP